ncbi:hypothetical protein [Pelotomaculum propionicicum]|uniref:Uncharacterized protein n=1 Tax=Pelotomaculum propionicicum TaxID=258475 RepID=A0A4Y7RNZ5_9FIRM|nr:hypothetical protein [Pelotomaculum propionicicum]NLI12330.1 hypothetical protein [Peptococcaceae bacterium]TEB10459.1 hypothetical protein Pmgp_02368 [Pelotomaculum propionicicum]
MVKLKEMVQLAEILGERLRDEKPDEKLVLRCVEAIWPYIYPYGLLSYIKEHAADPPEKIDKLKADKILKAVLGPKRKWRGFIMGLCHTYRERHSLKRARVRMVNKAALKGVPLSTEELDNLAEKFREQALTCDRAIKEVEMGLFHPASAVEQVKLAKSVRNDENIPIFLRFSRYLDFEWLLSLLPAETLEVFKSRYDKPSLQTLSFDALQEYICFNDELWADFKDKLLKTYLKAN